MTQDKAQTQETMATGGPQRFYYIDWLRVLAMLSIFLFHNARFYNYDSDWHVRNAAEGLGPTIIVGFLDQWIMPLFFVLAGMSAFYALRVRSAGQFARERFTRLLVPLLFLGMFVLGPAQIYLDRLSHAEFSGSFWQFYPHYFDGVHPFGGNFAWHGVHLWFLLYLFLFSIVTLPLLVPRKATGKSLISGLSVLFEKPWTILLLAVPIAAVMAVLNPESVIGTRDTGGWPLFAYVLFFLSGYLIASNPRIHETIRRYGGIALVIGLGLTIWGFITVREFPYGTLEWAGLMTLQAVNTWCWLIAILSLGSRFLNRSNRALRYSNEAVLPFYILHQPVILVIGFFVVQWDLGIAPKYFIITTASFVAIMAIYEILVRRVGVLRFLFGMRQKKRKEDAGRYLRAPKEEPAVSG